MAATVKKSYLEFPNAIIMRRRVELDSWYEALLEFSEAIVLSDNYQTSPVGFRILAGTEDGQGTVELEFFASVGFEVNHRQAEDGVSSSASYLVGDTIMTRKHDQDAPITQVYKDLLGYAQDNGIKVGDDFYHILLTLYDEPLVDVHAKVLEA
jgi:effector-binding domain-containing protein